MAQYTAYANYVIYFRDTSDYNFAVSLSGSNLLEMSPGQAAAQFGFVDGVNFNTGGALNAVKGMYTACIYGLGDPGNEIGHPAPSGIFMSMNVPFRIVPGQAGNPASVFPAGPDLKLIWSATIVHIGTGASPDVPTRAPVPLRRWISGFEYQAFAEGGTTGGINFRSRDSSRTLDGVGYGLRNPINTNFSRALNEYQTTLTSSKSWERFYMRVRTFGAINLDLWKTTGAPSPSSGGKIYITPAGDLTVFNVTAAAVETLIGTISGVFLVDIWHKIDVLVEYNSAGAGGNGRIRVYVDGVLGVDATVAVGSGGLGGNSQTHTSTLLGTQTATPNVWEIDLDDWTNADIPNIAGVETLNSIDWLTGTHVKRVWVESGSLGTWVGQVQSMNQMMLPSVATAGATLVSSLALDTMVGLTDATDDQDFTGQSLCASAAIISLYGQLASGAVSGKLGYKLAGGASVLTAITEGVVAGYKDIGYIGSGADVIPQSIVPFSVVHEKANSSITATVRGLAAIVEYIGVWGLEDDPLTISLPRLALNHNAWYPSIAWAFLGPVSDGPIAVKGGTYTGNGTQQSVPLPLPCHFLWIRPLTGTSEGTKWFGACLGGHLDSKEGVIPEHVIRTKFDPLTGITSFIVVGTNANTNAIGVVYQYIAFCDPAMQYNICGAFMHTTAVASAVNPLIDNTFTPEAAFFSFDTLAAGNNIRISYKGPGHTANAGNRLDGTALANLAALSTGAITSGADAHNGASFQTNYSVWRNANNCASVMVQMFSYVGNGAAGTRVIPSTPVSSRFPLFVYVQPHNAVGFVKDPSDVTTSSRNVDTGAASATAITAVGIDTITVGVTLNANLIVYDVFIIPGDTSGFNNGTFFPSSCLPTALVSAPIPPLPGINILPEGGLELGDSVPITVLKDISGIYTIVPGKLNDTLYDRLSGQPSVDVAIPDPNFTTGYIGG